MSARHWQKTTGRGLHQALMPDVDSEGTVLRTLVIAVGSIDGESAIEALARAQLFFRDLMTHRAGDAVFGGSVVLVVRIKWEMCEDLRLAVLGLCLQVNDGHVAYRALVFDHRFRLGMIERLAAHTALPVRIARRIRHHTGAPIEADGNVLTRFRSHSIVAGNAPVRGMKLGLQGTLPRAASHKNRRGEQYPCNRNCVPDMFAHYQPSVNLP